MKLSEIVNKLPLKVNSYSDGLQKDVKGGYSSDLLSDVLANSSEGNVWITLQTNLNIVAVASVKNLAGIIIVGNKKPPEETLKKAGEEKITIMTTTMPAFETAGKIYQLLLRSA
ncbi:MAG: serine kinase [Nitrospirae bacterium]|nr:serine kinase [Nitrospirota bacterium]